MMKTLSDSSPLISFNFVTFINDFLQLTKFRLAISVVFSSIAGYLLAVDHIDSSILMGLLFGGFAMVGASNAFNQWIEKEKDSLMDRTKNRPLPSGRMNNLTALVIASLLTLVGIFVSEQHQFQNCSFRSTFDIYIHLYLYPSKICDPLQYL